MRPVWAAAQVAAQIATNDHETGIISGSTILGIVLGCIVLWAIIGGVYTFIKRRRKPTYKTPPSTTVNPMIKYTSEEVIREVLAVKQTSPPLRGTLEDFTIGKPAILSVSINNKIVSGVVHTPVNLPSPQLKPRSYVFDRRDLQVFQATTVRNMRPGSRIKQIRREET